MELVCETASNSSSYSCTSPDSSVTSTYEYNGDGLRMEATPAGGSLEQFTWDTDASTPMLLEDGSDFYLYGPNVGSAPIEQITVAGSSPSYLISDTTGVREQIGPSGDIAGTMTYASYGSPCDTCSMSSPFGYQGAYTDATGLVYLVNRYYDPSTGQFLSVDPLVNQTGQPFSYAGDDPVNETDPDGDCWYCVFDPWSHANPIYEGAYSDPTGLGAEAVQTFDPAYTAINGYYNEWEATENGCGLSTELGYGAEGVVGVGGTELFALGGAGAVSGLGGAAADEGADSITGFTQHGLEQALGRDGGVGVSDSAMADAVSNPEEVIPQSDGAVKYVGKNAVVVLNSDGKVITTWATSSAGTR
ncbi:MAG: RHS repeat-associated core domain-containing protein [Acidimicrobiales bacterium]